MAWAVLILTIVWSVVFGVLSLDVEKDDDVLKFLPRTNPDIQAFYEINDAFGSTEVAIVGIRTSDVFNADFLTHLRELTLAVKNTQGVDHVLTLTNVADFVKDPVQGGIVAGTLIEDMPTDVASSQALRAKVMSRDHVVGNLVSREGDAVVLYAWIGRGNKPREVAKAVRATVEQHFPSDEKVWGGAPFISDYIYSATEADLERLSPWSILAILLIVMVSFRDLVGTGLGVATTGIGILTANGLMALAGEPFNIVLSSMPVILFATGSAYGVHTLAKYYQHAAVVGPGSSAVERTLVEDAPNVIAAGLTTVAGMWSLCLMDIEPMRVFGLYTGLGILASLVSALTLVPAVMTLFPRPARASIREAISAATLAVALRAREARRVSVAVIGVIVVLGSFLVTRVDTRMDLATFFDPGSEPALSETFLEERFGGSQFIQLRVAADLSDPLVLREMARIADRVAVIPHVSSVQGVHMAMEIINDAMSGARRVPDTSGQMGVLYRFLSSDPAVERLITDEREQALLVVKIDESDADVLEVVLAEVERVVEEEAMTQLVTVQAASDPDGARASVAGLVSARLAALGKTFQITLPADAGDQVAKLLAEPPAQASAREVAEGMTALLRSGESFVQLEPAQATAVGAALAELGPASTEDGRRAAIAAALPADPTASVVGDLLLIVDAPLRDAWRAGSARAAADVLLDRLQVKPPPGPAGERFVALLGAKLQDRDNPTFARSEGPEARAIGWTVSGQPVLYRGLSRSVTQNQMASLLSSLGMCWVIMSVMLRSVLSGLLATMPTVVTLVLVYGAMGLMGVHLDVGTSMIASMVVGTAVDYALHMLSSWEARDDEPITEAIRRAIDDSGFAIWTNALMVAAGFFVLTLGEARPLRNVGSLTAGGMLISAVATFVVIPVLANRKRYAAAPKVP